MEKFDDPTIGDLTAGMTSVFSQIMFDGPQSLVPESVQSFQAGAAFEAARVSNLVTAFRSDRALELDRKLAEVEMDEGVFANMRVTVMSPTPEWFNHHEHTTFTPDLNKGTVRTVENYRAFKTTQISRLHSRGQITDEQFASADWFHRAYERSGFEGRLRCSDISKEVRVSGVSGFMFTHDEVDAQDELRFVRLQIRSQFRKLFELVSVGDVPLTRAARMAPSGRHPLATFRNACDAATGGIRGLKDRLENEAKKSV